MGPVPFILYINDMHRSSDQLRFVHFADDTTVFASDSDINGVHASVNRELVGVDNWLKTNRLSLNVSKSSYMIISNQENSLDIKIRKTILTKVSTVKKFLSGRIGKVVASHAAVARLSPTEIALIYTMHEELRGYCP